MTSAAPTSPSARPRILVLWNQASTEEDEADEDADGVDDSEADGVDDGEDAPEADGVSEVDEVPGAGDQPPAAPPAVRAVLDVLRARGYDAADVNVEDDIDRIAAAVVIERPAVIFNLVDELHGDTALLASLAAYLELLEVPVVGADPACLHTCHDRVHAHLVLRDARIPVPGFVTVRDIDAVPPLGDLRPPLIVTQALDDVYHDEGLERPLDDRGQVVERVAALAAEYDLPFLVEEYLPGRRLHALVLGHGPLQVLPLVEAARHAPGAGEPGAPLGPPSWASSWASSWVLGALDRDTADHVAALAARAFRALGCRDVACVDVLLDADGRPYVVDVRPVVDFGPDGPLHAAAELSERGFAGVVVDLVERAAQR
jgi:D-alanine-D-alanine ligase